LHSFFHLIVCVLHLVCQIITLVLPLSQHIIQMGF
jgi:hypothetical protein